MIEILGPSVNYKNQMFFFFQIFTIQVLNAISIEIVNYYLLLLLLPVYISIQLMRSDTFIFLFTFQNVDVI